MNSTEYKEIREYLTNNLYPIDCSSKSNFKKKATKYSVNIYGYLERNGKLVLQRKDLGDVWAQFHRTHSGVTLLFVNCLKEISTAYIGVKRFLQCI